MTLRRRNATLVGVTTLSLALLIPAAEAAKAPKRDSLRGTGTTAIATVTIKAFNKGTMPSDQAKGTFTAKGTGIDIAGPVSCLHVNDNNAGLIYRVEKSGTPAIPVGTDVFVTVIDNGPGKKDKMAFLPPGTTPPDGGCSPSIMWDMDVLTVDEGNFVIKDAQLKTGF